MPSIFASSRCQSALLIALAAFTALRPVQAADAVQYRSLWSTSPATASGAAPLFAGQTLRQIVQVSAAGGSLRLKLTQRYGQETVALKAITIGIRQGDAGVRPGSLRTVRFAGASTLAIDAGQTRFSDPIDLAVKPFDSLVISVTVASYVSALTRHPIARQRSYGSSQVDAANSLDGAGFRTTSGANATSWLLIESVDAVTPALRTVAAVGDSYSDGFISSFGTAAIAETARLGLNERYPDFLARRLQQRYPDTFTVVIAAISGNRINTATSTPAFGPPLLERLDQDVLAIPGLTDVILLEGINDLGGHRNDQGLNADAVIAGLSTAISRLQVAGIRVWLGTLPPVLGSVGIATVSSEAGSVYGTAPVMAARRTVNDWIRQQRLADGVVDFDACLRDPTNAEQLRRDYDSGDHLHPNPAGYSAMADCVDLERLR